MSQQIDSKIDDQINNQNQIDNHIDNQFNREIYNCHKFHIRLNRICNKLPVPFFLFIYLTISVIFLSVIFNHFEASVLHPRTGNLILVKSLLSRDGIAYMLTSMVSNFTKFAPLGLVLVISLGIGLANEVGLFSALIKKTILKAPASLVTYTVM